MSTPLYVVEVEERIDPRLARRRGADYAAPAQPEGRARLLAALLLGIEDAPEGEGPWRRPVAGGTRVVRLVAVGQGATG